MKVLRNKNFFILFSGQVISSIGDRLYYIALPWYVYVLTDSKLDLMLAGLAMTLPGMAAIFSGVLVDRWPKRQVMICSDALRALIALVMYVFALWRCNFIVFLPLVFILEFAGTFFSPAAGALIPLIVSGEELPEAMGLNQSGTAASRLIGTVAGGGLMTLVGAPLLFLGNAVSFVVSVISLLFIRVNEQARASGTTLYSQWLEGIRVIASSKTLLQLIGAALFTNFGLTPLGIVLIAWVKGPMHGSAFTLSLVLAALSAGMITGGICLGMITRRLGLQSIFRAGLFIIGISVGLVGLWPDLWWCAGLTFVAGFIVAALNGTLSVLLVGVVPENQRGRIFGALGGLSVLASPLGMAVFGALMTHTSLPLVFALIGAASIMGGISCLVPVKNDLQPGKFQEM